MPNITSYSGSWIFWFAEREAQPRASPDIHPPAPLRKVDPKYFADAVDARREGKVRLAAVIRRTGRIDTVTLISGFDARLDGSAAEALAKWEFEPARRNGTPVDVDAVVEIPFRLAPKIIK
jgi:TonB family protein